MNGNTSLVEPKHPAPSRWWIFFLLGRIISYALMGGLITGISGALLVATVGGLTGWVLYFSINSNEIWQTGVFIGLGLGGTGGAITGGILLGISAFFSAPKRSWLPPRRFIIPTLKGMALGTLAVTASFAVMIGTLSIVMNGMTLKGFAQQTGDILPLIMFGVPAVMLCGQVAGAVSGFRRDAEPKQH